MWNCEKRRFLSQLKNSAIKRAFLLYISWHRLIIWKQWPMINMPASDCTNVSAAVYFFVGMVSLLLISLLLLLFSVCIFSLNLLCSIECNFSKESSRFPLFHSYSRIIIKTTCFIQSFSLDACTIPVYFIQSFPHFVGFIWKRDKLRGKTMRFQRKNSQSLVYET